MVLSVYQTLNFQLILNPEHVIQNLKKYSLISQVLNLFFKDHQFEYYKSRNY
jgi:hypothetical protein